MSCSIYSSLPATVSISDNQHTRCLTTKHFTAVTTPNLKLRFSLYLPILSLSLSLSVSSTPLKNKLGQRVTIIQISVSSETLTDITRKLSCVRSRMQHTLTQPWKTPEFDIDWENPVFILKLGLQAETFHFFLNR